MRALAAGFLMLVILASVAMAQAAPRIGEGDVLRGRFVQERHLQGFTAPLRSEGSFVLAPEHGLIWKTEKPFAVTTVITEAGLTQTVDGSQVLHMAAAKLPFLSHLYRMLGGALAGNWEELGKDFTVARRGDDNDWQLELRPKRTDGLAMPFRSIALKGTRFVDEVTLTKANGDFDRLTFLDQALSAPLTAEENRALESVAP
jgi:outer membrane lipoprotein-sorting protein